MNKIDEFLNNFEHSTQLAYKSALKKYFDTINKDPNTYIKQKRQYSDEELESYETDIKYFWQQVKHMPPNTVRQYLSVIKVFLQEFYIDLPNKFWNSFKKRMKGTRTRVQDIVPTKKQFKKIITHGNALEKALVTTLLSSGMRIGELCQITIHDIDFDFQPVKIEIRAEYTKTGNKRTVFISEESKEFIQEWLKEKPAYLERALKILNIPGAQKNIDDDRIFPMASGVARQKWNRLLRKSGFIEQDTNTSTPRYKIHPHVTRKFYRTWMAKDLGKDMTEYFLGHEEGLDAVYRRYGDDSNKKLLGDEYLKGMHNVSIFMVTPDLTEHTQQIEALQKENKDLRKDLDTLIRKLMINNYKPTK